MQRPWIWILLAAPTVLVLSFFVLMLSDQGSVETRPAPTRVSGEAAIGGPFELVAHTGETVTEADFAGKAMLIYFGFTYCPDVCPFSLQVMDSALGRLPEADRAEFQPILISLDPERDTPEAMAQYVSSPAFPDNLIGLTGSVDQVSNAATAYRVAYRKSEGEAEDGSDYLIDHSSIIYLMDGEGRFVDVFGHGTDPQRVAERLQDFLEEERAS